MDMKNATKTDGAITDKLKIMEAAVSKAGAVTYLHDRATLVRWELAGLVYVSDQFSDFDKYRATDAGRSAFARLALP